MIAKLDGNITDIFSSFIILSCGGVGYKVTLPLSLLNQAKVGQKAVYYIYTHVKEDALSFYGFNSKKELEFFEMLLGISNIGPKTAISVLNLGSVDEIISAIVKADSNYFLQVPRIGRKNAQRIIIELREKIGALEEIDLTFAQSQENKDIIEALLSFGFAKKEIKEVLAKLPQTGTVEEKIKMALKNLGRKQK